VFDRSGVRDAELEVGHPGVGVEERSQLELELRTACVRRGVDRHSAEFARRVVNEILGERDGLRLHTERLQERADGLVHDGRLDKNAPRASIELGPLQHLQRTKLALRVEEDNAECERVRAALGRLNDVLRVAGDDAKVDGDFAVAGLPDERDEAALHQSLAACTLPERGAVLRVLLPSYRRRSADWSVLRQTTRVNTTHESSSSELIPLQSGTMELKKTSV
jgi:hypothetical protein